MDNRKEFTESVWRKCKMDGEPNFNNSATRELYELYKNACIRKRNHCECSEATSHEMRTGTKVWQCAWRLARIIHAPPPRKDGMLIADEFERVICVAKVFKGCSVDEPHPE
jgi:hypothetical protein